MFVGMKVDVKGCVIKDVDNDGVVDVMDECFDIVVGVKVDVKGCIVFDEEMVEIILCVFFDNESVVVKMFKDFEILEFVEFMK